MPEAMMVPDEITWSHQRCLQKERPGKRRNIFLNLMPEARVVLNEFIYSATISACEKGSQ